VFCGGQAIGIACGFILIPHFNGGAHGVKVKNSIRVRQIFENGGEEMAPQMFGRVTPHSDRPFLDYSQFMNCKKLFFEKDRAVVVLGAVLFATLTGCVGYVRGPRAEVYVAPPVVQTDVVVEDDYVYYPAYDVYYNSSRRQYAYLEGGAWVSRPEPRGVTVDVLFASPSVRMDFHDSPAHHHAEQ
jgi:hypothetical protein